MSRNDKKTALFDVEDIFQTIRKQADVEQVSKSGGKGL
jgi:hypothetical protein